MIKIMISRFVLAFILNMIFSLLITSCQESTKIPNDVILGNNVSIQKVHDTVYVPTKHDTVYQWDISQSKGKFKHLKLLCVDAYGQEDDANPIKEGKVYTTMGEIMIDSGDSCYYIDGIGSKKIHRFVKLLK